MSTTLPSYSLVIATMDRPASLDAALASLSVQTCAPARVIVVDASESEASRAVCAKWQSQLQVQWIRAELMSAAQQRNQGAAAVTTPIIGFMDDDVVLPADTLAKLLEPFSRDTTGGVAGRISGLSHPPPRGLLWCYYRLQAGYSHPHYGGRVIGPAINLIPAFEAESSAWVRSDWLNSTLVLYRRELFERERFPLFEGYSFLEDAHLSYRVGRTHRLYFHRDAIYEHHSQCSRAKADPRRLAHMIVQHQYRMARDVMRIGRTKLALKLALHRLFQTVVVVRRGGPDLWPTIRGIWDRL
ncbi:glycosyltransferase family 2 protein [Opitutus sp. ER46]|uniref:glycosyltransferase family 2 protein n=1 Tax=Opitutus sp. ER46 TaxID=2161864 RepID=UPI0011B20125|nr:glycosyltransferase family 2 protein [Opitutus sp. ER46]